MLSKLLSRWSRPQQKPTPIYREPLPEPAPQDWALADEEPYSEADLEACLQGIRALTEKQPKKQTDFFVSLGQAERFILECAEFGPGETHHIARRHVEVALQGWLNYTGRTLYDHDGFYRALLTHLEWRGGHVMIRDGQPVYVGFRLSEETINIINAQHKNNQDLVCIDGDSTKSITHAR